PYQITADRSLSGMVTFDPSPYIAISAPTVQNTGFSIPPGTFPTIDFEAIIEAALPWWRPLEDFFSHRYANSSGLVGDILPDDLTAQIQYALTLVGWQLQATRTGTRYHATGRVLQDSHNNYFFSITSQS